MSNIITPSAILTHLLKTRQSEAELAIEDKNEASFFNKYKWLIVGGLFAFIIQILAGWWFLNRRRNRKAREADEENARLAKTFSNVGVVNVWGNPMNPNPNQNMNPSSNPSGWNAPGPAVGGLADIPPAYDGRREELDGRGKF